VEKPQSENLESVTTSASLPSPKKPVAAIEMLRRTEKFLPAAEQITLSKLASELSVDVERLRPLIDHQYLKLIKVKEFLDDCIVARPYPDGMRWLHNMLAPLPLQPLLPLKYAAEMLYLSLAESRSVCVYYDVQVQSDPAFGELLTIEGFYKLFDKLNKHRGSCRFDRQAMFQALSYGIDKPMPKRKVIPYDQMLEDEIRRVRKMEEPERGFRAIALYRAFKDAKNLDDCRRRYWNNNTEPQSKQKRRKAHMERAEELLENLMKRSFGQSSVETPPVPPSDAP
jgi:hypothetical protein